MLDDDDDGGGSAELFEGLDPIIVRLGRIMPTMAYFTLHERKRVTGEREQVGRWDASVESLLANGDIEIGDVPEGKEARDEFLTSRAAAFIRSKARENARTLGKTLFQVRFMAAKGKYITSEQFSYLAVDDAPFAEAQGLVNGTREAEDIDLGKIDQFIALPALNAIALGNKNLAINTLWSTRAVVKIALETLAAVAGAHRADTDRLLSTIESQAENNDKLITTLLQLRMEAVSERERISAERADNDDNRGLVREIGGKVESFFTQWAALSKGLPPEVAKLVPMLIERPALLQRLGDPAIIARLNDDDVQASLITLLDAFKADDGSQETP